MIVGKISKAQLTAVIVVIFIVVVFGLYLYQHSLKKDLANNTWVTLEEIMEQQRFNFYSEMSAEKANLENFSQIIGNVEQVATRYDVLREVTATTKFDNIAIVDVQGNGITTQGRTFYVGDRAFFKSSLSGLTVLAGPVKSILGEDEVITCSTSFHRGRKLEGVLLGTYSAEKLNALFLSSFSGKGYVFVVGPGGEIIASTSNAYTITTSDNYFDTLGDAKFGTGYSYNDILTNMGNKASGRVIYSVEGKTRLAQYSPVGINDWYIFCVVPEDIIAAQSARIAVKAAILAFIIVICAIAFIVYIFNVQKGIQALQDKFIEDLKRMAYVDDLTGAPNFSKFKMDASALLEKYPQVPFAIVKFDVDRFKLLNELFGYEEGNSILWNIAKAIEQSLDPAVETYGRINADEFIILLQCGSYEELDQRKVRFEERFAYMYHNEAEYKFRFPTGRYLIEAGEKDIAAIYEKVNLAHRLAKQEPGVTGVRNYDGNAQKLAIQEKEIENKMEHALGKEEFKLFLQAKYRLAGEKLAGAEALVRWRADNGLDILYPGQFIPLFEQNGFITRLDMYMFTKACQAIKDWMDQGVTPITISVNFSRLHLGNPDFVDTLCAIADLYRVPRNCLEIELTETTMFDNEQQMIVVFENLHEAGFTLSMDDFGTGYSSLGMLKNIPVDVIKMDRGFFTSASDTQRAKTVIAGVMDMAKKLHIHTVAEGVETQEHIDLLRELGCDIVQGYYYARPVPLEEFKLEDFKREG